MLQLCSQVAHVVETVLTGELGDDDLFGLHVASVIPASHRGRLLVTVAPGPWQPTASAELILARLQAHARRIRAEVGTAITRRKTPELTFIYVPHGPEHESGKAGGSEDRHA